MMNKLYLLLPLILLVGCTTPTCPVINCPSCNCPTQQPTQEQDLLTIYFIDVGQGDSILIKYQDKEMLIDCGKNNQGVKVTELLKDVGVTRLEYLMITHPDSDHLGGCDDVLRAIPTDVVITNGEQHDTISYKEVMDEIDTEQLKVAKEWDDFNLGPVKIDILQSNNYLSDQNQNSIVAKLTFNSFTALLTGDCDDKCEDLLLNKNISAKVLKVAHHGTKYATYIDFLEKVNPEIAVISVGSNSYGHPASETLGRLSQEGVITYRTDIESDIIVETDGNNYVVK